jgi:tetratricopeptide (TPR) repeat protein
MDDLEGRNRTASMTTPVLARFVAVAGILMGACGSSNQAPAASGSSVLAPPEGRQLQPVPRPDFSVMGPAVQQRIREAYTVLTSAVEDRAATPERLANAYGEVGNLLLALKELETAEPYYLNAQTLAPGDRRWPHLLGHLYRTRGPVDKAVASYERARQIAPDEVATLVRLGDVYLAMGRHDAAAPLFERALTLEPGSAAAWFGAGQVALARNDDRAAVKALEEALARDPDASAIHYPLAMAYRRLGNADQARAHLARRGDVEPRADPLVAEIDARLERDSALMLDFRGGEALAAGNWATAADYFERALKLSPDSPSLRHRLGTALFRMGDVKGAEEQFDRVLSTTPAYRDSHYNLALIKAQTGRLETAIAQLSTALGYEPDDTRARVTLARFFAVAGRPAEALTQYTTALEKEPRRADAALGYAMTLSLLERYPESRDRLSDGMRTFSEDPRFGRALTRLLAAAPDDSVRNGRRALAMAEALLEQRQQNVDESLAVGETYAMALAESGQSATAAAVQRDVRAAAEKAEASDNVVRRLSDNLARYERGVPCRRPWTADELPL